MLGWRKLSAWFLVYVMTGATMVLGQDIGPIAADMLKIVTVGFFISNAVKPAAQGLSEKLK